MSLLRSLAPFVARLIERIVNAEWFEISRTRLKEGPTLENSCNSELWIVFFTSGAIGLDGDSNIFQKEVLFVLSLR